MQSEFKKYTEANREAWNEVMPMHRKAAGEKWDAAFRQPGFVCIRDVELESLRRIGIKDKAVEEAQERARRCQIDCQYVRTDVYEIAPEYENRFDVVYISSGGLGWMPDLNLFFAKAATLLRKNGQIFIHEIHPFSEMMPFDSAEGADPLRIVEPYFKAEPYVDCGGLDYVGGSQYISTKPQYWFVYKLSDILMGLVENRISIEHFSEHETDISAGHKRIEQARVGIPLSYILIGRKKNAG